MDSATVHTRANLETYRRLCDAEPFLEEVRVAGEVLPGMTTNTILTSGPPHAWEEYVGGQREAIIGGALFEGLAKDHGDAVEQLSRGNIRLGSCHDYGAVGSLAGIYTAS